MHRVEKADASRTNGSFAVREVTADAGYVLGPPGLGLLADLTSSAFAIISASVVLVVIGAIFAVASPEKRSQAQP